MPLYFFYTMVQKSQKWPKTQIKVGSCIKPGTKVLFLFLSEFWANVFRATWFSEANISFVLVACRIGQRIMTCWSGREQRELTFYCAISLHKNKNKKKKNFFTLARKPVKLCDGRLQKGHLLANALQFETAKSHCQKMKARLWAWACNQLNDPDGGARRMKIRQALFVIFQLILQWWSRKWTPRQQKSIKTASPSLSLSLSLSLSPSLTHSN